MKLSYNPNRTKPMILAEHKGQTLEFLATVAGRKSFQPADGSDVFQFINEFWAGQPESFQDEVFSLYQKSQSALDYAVDTKSLYDELNGIIRRMYQLHPLGRLHFFLSCHPAVTAPDTALEVKPDPRETAFTAEKTYDRREYYELVSLSLFFRTLVPIWGDYIGSIRKSSEMQRKEHMAMELTNNTGILECDPVVRLSTYINAMMENIDPKEYYDKILSGFSTEDIPFLFLSLTCIRKISLADLTGTNSNNALSQLFKFISQRSSNQQSASSITIKEFKSEEGDKGATKHSILESYRKRAEISEGEKAEMACALKDLMGIALRLDPDITEAEVYASVETAQRLMVERLTEVQEAIAGAMLKDQITPFWVGYVDKQLLVNVLGVCEAVLWRRGEKYMAMLATSHVVITNDDFVAGTISSREQLPQALVTELESFFPLRWRYEKKSTEIDPRSDIMICLDQLTDILTSNAFRATAAEPKLEEVFGEVRRKVKIFANVKEHLASFFINNEKHIIQQHGALNDPGK